MRSGNCPKCGEAKVHTARGAFGWGSGQGVRIRTSAMVQGSQVDTYICTACGYFENYVADPGKLAEVAQVWERPG